MEVSKVQDFARRYRQTLIRIKELKAAAKALEQEAKAVSGCTNLDIRAMKREARQAVRAPRLKRIEETGGRPLGPEWAKLRAQVFRRDDYTCRYCGARTKRPACDHVIPVTRGGRNELSNLVTACRPCNSSKRDKLPQEWLGGALAFPAVAP